MILIAAIYILIAVILIPWFNFKWYESALRGLLWLPVLIIALTFTYVVYKHNKCK